MKTFARANVVNQMGSLYLMKWVEQIKEYIEKHFDEALTLDILAEMCHGSPFIYNALSKITGISPIEYIQQFRIVKAAEHLLHTNQPIKRN